MMNIRQLLVLLLFTAFLVPSCKDKSDPDCLIGNYRIESLQPAANPGGYEIFIKATGVSDTTKVYFDEVESPSVKTAEGGLIVKVPTNITGVVSLSIEDGECSDSKPFEVLGSYPGNVPAGSTTVIIPQAPGSVPSNISNEWPNVFDSKHKVGLFDDFSNPDGILDPGTEQHEGTETFLDDNPVSGHYSFTTNEIFVVIDRTSKPGGYRDTLTGQFIQNIPQGPADAVYTILLTSKRTGRQLILYKNF